MRKHRRRHIRVAYQVVRRALQLLAVEAADLHKGIVAVGDLTFQVSGGNQSLLGREGAFALSDRQILAHSGIHAVT